MAGAHAASATAGRIGPNAVIQTVAALSVRVGDLLAGQTLSTATGRTLETLPEEMVLEEEANALMAAVRAQCGEAEAAAVMWESGERTAAYLLANRIPKPAQTLIRLLPAALGMRVLLSAVSKHAWTFAGTGRFTYRVGRPTVLRFADCAICRGHRTGSAACDYYAATFETLLRTLVDDRTRVREVECSATGGTECRFLVTMA